MIIWLTGRSGAGKTTIAKILCEKDSNSVLLDGDEIRKAVGNKDFSPQGRKTHLKYVALLANFAMDLGSTVVCSFITPSEDSRRFLMKISGLKMVYLECSPKEARKRDVKGLYAAGTAGIYYYEVPEKYNLKLNTEELTAEQCVEEILSAYN